MTIDKAKLDELKQKYGSVWTFSRGDVHVVFRKPANVEYRKYSMAISADKANLFDACEAMVKACIVHPGPEERDRILEEWPGLVIALGSEISNVASLGQQAEAKKA